MCGSSCDLGSNFDMGDGYKPFPCLRIKFGTQFDGKYFIIEALYRINRRGIVCSGLDKDMQLVHICVGQDCLLFYLRRGCAERPTSSRSASSLRKRLCRKQGYNCDLRKRFLTISTTAVSLGISKVLPQNNNSSRNRVVYYRQQYSIVAPVYRVRRSFQVRRNRLRFLDAMSKLRLRRELQVTYRRCTAQFLGQNDPTARPICAAPMRHDGAHPRVPARPENNCVVQLKCKPARANPSLLNTCHFLNQADPWPQTIT